jgi:RNA polymerase sigma-70 factor (ECF subfamily)
VISAQCVDSLAMPASEPLTTASALLKKAQEWDSQALGEIHDRYYARVYRYVFFRVGDEALAEDIASEVFVRLLAALRANQTITNLTGWLFGVAAHLVVDHFRRAPREHARLSEEFRSMALTDAEAEANLQLGEIRAAMQRLTPDQQNVLTLRFGGGFNLEQTAQLMGKTINAVKVLQFRATAALRRLLNETTHDGSVD